MSTLQQRQIKIQEKRKQTLFRDFVMEICSWQIANIYKLQSLISRFPDTDRKPKTVSPKDFGKEIISIEYNDSFFSSLQLLYKNQEQMSLMQWFENENSDFSEVYGGKNCYLSFSVGGNAENVLYSLMSNINIHNIYNSFFVIENCSNIYMSRVVTESINIFYSSNIHSGHNIWFSANLLGCHECLFCNSLDNQSYCIENISYSKEEYSKRKEDILKNKGNFEIDYSIITKIKVSNKISTDVVGGGIINSQNILEGYFVNNIHHGKNLFGVGSKTNAQNFYDCLDSGNSGDNDLYGVHYTGEHSSYIYCSSSIAASSYIFYSYFLESCSFCLGCIGLKNKSYCILNKQYTKEERYEKVDEIFGQMERDGTLGEFFPASMNPFYFNDTAAYLIDPSFTKEEVTKLGYLRRDEPIKVDIPEGAKVVKVSELGDYEGWKDMSPGGTKGPGQKDNNGIVNGLDSSVVPPSEGQKQRYIDPEILKVIIQDEQGNIYKIVKMEYDFLMKYGLPLPRQHRLDRMKENFKI